MTINQPPPMNAPRAVELGIGVQPGTPNIIRARQVIISGAGDYLFVYSGTPALGNLVASEASAAGRDIYGNYYFAGQTSYNLIAGTYFAANSNGSNVTFYTAATPGGPYSNMANVGVDASGDLTLASQNAAISPLSPFVGVSALQPGTTGTAETWHSATLATGWTGSIRYKLSAEVNRVWLEVNATFTDDGTNHLASGKPMLGVSLPSHYQPAASTPDMAAWVGGSGLTIAASRIPGIRVTTSGQIFVDDVSTSALNNTAIFNGEFSYPLD